MALTDLSATIEDLAAESSRPKKSRVQDVSELVNTICDSAYQSGLSNADLRAVLELLKEPSSLDQSNITTLIKSLYPSERIPSSCASLVVACLGPGDKKPSPATQNLLLWWLGCVRTALNEWNVLEKLYSILFNLLDALTIRANLCRILCLITRRKHVKPWRIHRLHELSQSASNDQSLVSLLKVYQTFYPDVIVPQGKSMEVFKGSDKEWISKLNAIQEQNEVNASTAAVFDVVEDGNKRRRIEIIPRLQTRQTQENSVVLEELRSIEDFGEKYERIEYPNQIIAALENHQLQRLMTLRNDDTLNKRLDDWLALFFDAHARQEGGEEAEDRLLSEVLEQLLAYSRQTKMVPQAFLAFLPRYLEDWNGRANRTTILKILIYTPLEPFKDLQARLLYRLEEKIIDDSHSGSLEVLLLYAKLVRRWSVALTELDSDALSADKNEETTIVPLIMHCTSLAIQLLVGDKTTDVQAIVQEFLQAVVHESVLALDRPHLRISIPPPFLVYLSLFSAPTIYTTSSLSGMLSKYKDTLEQYLPKQKGSKAPLHFPRSSVGEFNGYVMDVCNLTWRGRAFNRTDNNAMGCLLPLNVATDLQEYVDRLAVDKRYTLATLFSLSNHPALSAVSIQALRNMEDQAIAGNDGVDDAITSRHAGPVTQRSLAQLSTQGGLVISWTEYRTEVLDLLAVMGADGLSELIQRSIKT